MSYDAGMKSKPTVFVGLSGGVDSAVAALRLKKQGYYVVGVFIKVWHPEFMVCNWEQERLDAMQVAAHLEIPFLTCDAEAAYRDNVADYFINEYKSGRTPNPDVLCNQKVKFGTFIEFAKNNKADFIATGHYAQKKKVDEKYQLFRGADFNKDQTYFLWSLTSEQLDFSLFPVGDTTKAQIRQEAHTEEIPVAQKNDSQGICFLGHVNIPEFLSHYIDLSPGMVLNEDGEIIGHHQGALVYTLGQRHGFTINTINHTRGAHFVVNKNLEQNTITVSTERPLSAEPLTVIIDNTCLRDSINESESLQVQFRYRQTPIKAQVKRLENEKIELFLSANTERPASGQSVVLYRDELCLGGGVVT
jgi:tRNA-specific 2-thiouridylase